MTEFEWLSCADPRRILAERRLSERKLRLFLAACCRQIWKNTGDDVTLAALEVAARLAEEQSRTTTVEVQVSSGEVVIDCSASDPLLGINIFTEDGKTKQMPYGRVPAVLRLVLVKLACQKISETSLIWAIELFETMEFASKHQAELLRDVTSYSPARLGIVPDETLCLLARSMYESEVFHGLAALGDALEEAGCTDAGILSHCRQPGEHVRGCWVVDLLLGKQ